MTTNSAESELIESRNAEAVQSPEQKAGEELLETLRQRLVEARLKRSEAGVNPRGSGSGSYGDCNEYTLPMKLVRQPNAEGNQQVLNVVARHYVMTKKRQGN